MKFFKLRVKNFSRFKTLEKADHDYFNRLLQERVITKNDNLILMPNKTEEIDELLKYCHINNIPLQITGNYKEEHKTKDNIYLCMNKLNRVLGYDAENQTILCEAGCTTEDLNKYLNIYNKTLPFSLQSTIGSIIATNMKKQFSKYGKISDNLKALEVATPEQSVIHVKNNFDKLVGSMGSLGIITEVKIICKEKYTNRNLVVLGLDSSYRCMLVNNNALRHFDKHLTAVEFFNGNSMTFLEKIFNMDRPFYNEYPFYLMLEVSSNREDNLEYLVQFLETENELQELIISTNDTQIEDLWKYRERLNETLDKKYLTYVSNLSIDEHNKLIEEIKKSIPNENIISYGSVSSDKTISFMIEDQNKLKDFRDKVNKTIESNKYNAYEYKDDRYKEYKEEYDKKIILNSLL